MKKFLPTILIAISLISCSTMRIQYDYDSEINFAQFRTFGWKQPADAGHFKNELMHKRARMLIKQELEAKGLVQSDDPDILVDYHQASRNRKEVTVEHSYHSWRWHGYHASQVYVTRYKKGTLIIDVFLVDKPQLIWRGWAKGIIINRGDSKDMLHKAIVKIFKNYPPEDYLLKN